MRLEKFGDTYDIVKQKLLASLANLGPWAAHPMFTEEVSGPEGRAFARFLGVPLLSLEVLAAATDRAAYFARAGACASHLFLDPDTGLVPIGLTPKNPIGSVRAWVARTSPSP